MHLHGQAVQDLICWGAEQLAAVLLGRSEAGIGILAVAA